MCSNMNWARRSECNVCQTAKPGASSKQGGVLHLQHTQTYLHLYLVLCRLVSVPLASHTCDFVCLCVFEFWFWGVQASSKTGALLDPIMRGCV